MSKVRIDIDAAIEKSVKEEVEVIISHHLAAAQNELYEKFDNLSDKFAKEVSEAARISLHKMLDSATPHTKSKKG